MVDEATAFVLLVKKKVKEDFSTRKLLHVDISGDEEEGVEGGLGPRTKEIVEKRSNSIMESCCCQSDQLLYLFIGDMLVDFWLLNDSLNLKVSFDFTFVYRCRPVYFLLSTCSSSKKWKDVGSKKETKANQYCTSISSSSAQKKTTAAIYQTCLLSCPFFASLATVTSTREVFAITSETFFFSSGLQVWRGHFEVRYSFLLSSPNYSTNLRYNSLVLVYFKSVYTYHRFTNYFYLYPNPSVNLCKLQLTHFFGSFHEEERGDF